MLEILTLVAGPAGAAVVLFLILWGFYKMLHEHLIPIVRDFLTRIVDEHKEDRITYRETITDLKEAIGRLSDGIVAVSKEVKDVSEKVDDVDVRLEKVEIDLRGIDALINKNNLAAEARANRSTE